MKVINIMNFVRQYEPRRTNKDHLMFEVIKEQLKFVNEEKLDNTFLLQYDVLCDENYVKLFKENVKENTGSTVSEMNISEEDFKGGRIIHH